MANKTIDQLTAAGALAGTEEVPIWQSAATVKTTIADIAKTPGVGTATQIAYFGASGELTGNTALTFDSGTGKLSAAVVKGGAGSTGDLSGAVVAFNSTGNAFLAATEPWVYDGEQLGIINAVIGTDYGSRVIACFKNQDTTGTYDSLAIAFKSYETPLISATGYLEFQNSGNGDGTAFFGFGFSDPASADIQFWSDGCVQPAQDNTFDLGRGAVGGFGPSAWRTGYFGTSVVSPDVVMSSGAASVIILPTADPAIAGALWNNLGTITISAG